MVFLVQLTVILLRSDVLTAVKMPVVVFGVVKTCVLVGGYQHFTGNS